MSKKINYLTFSLLVCLLFSCNGHNKFIGKKFLLTPVGAPTLAIYDEVSKNKEVETTSTTTEVSSALLTNDYKYLIFDAITAQNLIKTKKSNYTFLKLLTGGNFHLIGINKNKDDLPTKEDYIIGFGSENNIPVKAFRKLYSEAVNDNDNEIKTFDEMASNITDLSTLIKAMDSSGKIGENKIDWIFIAQPALFTLLSAKTSDGEFLPFKSLATVDIDIRNTFKEKFNSDYIPQAGLFVNNYYYDENKEEVATFSSKVDQYLNDAIYDSSKVVDSINSYSNDLNEQKARFGYNSKVINALQGQKEGKYLNQFGIVDPKSNYTLDKMDEFVKLLNN